MSKFVLTAQLQLQAPNNVSQIVSQIQSQLNNVSVNVQVKGSAQANQQLQQITQSTQAATTAAGRMGNAFAVSIRRFAAFSIATRAVGLFTSTLSQAVQTAIDFERELVKISQVTGKSVSSLRDLTDTVTSLATGLGVTSGSLLEVTTVLTQAGLSSDDTKIALESLAKAALAPNFDSISETAEGAIAILAQFKQGVGALEGQLSSIDAVAGAFAVEAGDLIDVIRRSGGVFKASGGSLNELLALFTSVRATTRESAESIGTGLRTIFTRIQRPETIEFLKQFGVELVDLNGKFVGPYEAIRKLSEAISGLGEGDLTFIKIAEELGGFRQIGKVLPLLQQFSTAQAALNVAQNAGNGLTKNAETAQASLAIRIIKVKEEFLALVRSMTETPTFQIMANTALALASALIKIADSIKPLLPLLGAVAAFKAVKGIGGFLGGVGSGLASGRTFHTGGKVQAFAKGGLVPGSGSGTADDVPAMVSSGEFVMKKSAVQRIGANNLTQMNNGGTVQKFKDGGRTIVGARANLKSKQVRDSKFDKKKDVAGSGNVQFDVQQGQVGAFVLSPPKGTEGGYNGQSYPFTLTPGKKGFDRYAPIIAKQSGLSVDDLKGGINATINPANYPVFYPGLTEGRQNLAKNSQYSNAVHRGFMDGISTGVNSTISSVASQGLLDLPPSLNTNENSIQNIIGKIQGDNQIRSTMEGYLFEGMISAFTGASAAGGTNNFDFPRAAISQNKNKLGTLFGSQAEINKLTKAEAKRSYGEVGTNIQRKLSNDIISGNISGVKLRTTGQKNKMSIGGIIQKFAIGGRAKGIQDAPLVDDILQASGSILPRPSTAIQALIKAGGGAVDVDRTLKRTVGDTAYAKAPTPGAKNASLDTYFRDEVKRLQDLKTAPMTQFGTELQAAIKNGQLNARKISIISKSKRVKGAAEYLSSQFGIPVQNMVFTQGASKQPALDAIRNKGSRVERVRKFFGGMIQKFAVGGKPDPRKSLENYFADSSNMNLGLANSKGLNKDQRTSLASDVRNLRQLRTPAPATLYSSISRVAFDKMASQVGFNKAPTIPESTKYNDVEKILDKEAKQIAGKSFSLPGFVSTSKDYSKAKTFLDNAPRSPDNWAAMLTIATKQNAKGVDVEKQLSGRKLNITKQDINPRTGKMETMYMNPPSSEQEVMLQPRSRFRITQAKAIRLGVQKNLWATAQQFATGGMVPGVGNSDTVPATLGEGDFVIRKSSVSKLGAENLASMAGYAAGGNVSKSVPALLTPGEFVFDEPSAKSIGYGNLNRMNKVGKYATGGFVGVQKFATGTSGTGAKSVISNIPVPGFDAKAPTLLNKILAQLTGTFSIADITWQKSSKDVKLLQTITPTLAKSLKDYANAANLSTKQQGQLAAAYGKLIATMLLQGQTNAQIVTSMQPYVGALAADTKAKLASAKATAAATAAGATPSASISPSVIKPAMPMSAPGSIPGMNNNTTAINANTQAQKSAAQSAMGVVNNNKMFVASMTTSLIGGFLPAIDENSGAVARATQALLSMTTVVFGTLAALETFNISLSSKTIFDLFSSAAGKGLSGLSAKAGGAAGSAVLGAGGGANLAIATSTVASGLTKLFGPIGLAATTFFTIKAAGNALTEAFMNYEGRLKKATESGDVEGARSIGIDKQNSNVIQNIIAANLAGQVTGAIIGFFSGGGPIGAAVGSTIGATIGSALATFFTGSLEYAGEFAASQATSSKAQNALSKASENATKALSDFEKGNISVTELLKSTSGAANAVANNRKQVDKLDAQSNQEISNDGFSGTLLRDVLTLGGLIGESTGQKQTRIQETQKQSRSDLNKQERELITVSQPLLNKASEEVAIAGGTFADVIDKINSANPDLAFALLSQGTTDLSKSFDNISREIERAQKSFAAMNLGMQNVQGAASAAALGVSNYVASQQAGNIGLEQSLAVLEASVTSAAQGISNTDFKKALSDVESTLRGFGANDEQINKFKTNISAVNEVQKNQSSIFGGARETLAENIRGSVGSDGRQKAFTKAIEDQLKAAGYNKTPEGQATIQRFKDASANMSDDQLKEIGKGNFQAFEESINELGKKTLEQVNGPIKAAIEIQKQLNELTKQRIEAERQLINAQLEASDVRMEAMDISAKYGGPKVTPQMRAQNVVEQTNIRSRGITGVTDIKTGSAAELSTRTQQLQKRQAEINQIRLDAADPKSPNNAAAIKEVNNEDFKNEATQIESALKSQIQSTRDLIKSKEEELRLIKEKNQLEKSSIDALVSGDIEKFFDQQAAVGAQAAVATGDQRLIGQFGMSALGAAAQETRRQQDAGVTSMYGQNLSGPQGLTERTFGAAISAAGLQNPLAMAQVAAGSTGAEAAVESDIRALAATMGPAADVQTQAAQGQLDAAKMQLAAAGDKAQEAINMTEIRNPEMRASGGLIYASNGRYINFQPRGTDTVPAMLTPGEFVINRAAVQRGNNLQILQSMNRGSNTAPAAISQSSQVATMAKGGKVRYFSGGGFNGGMQSQEAGGGGGSGGSGSGFGFNLESLGKFAEALTNFNAKLTENITNLANTKFEITLNPTNVNVNLTGASLLKDLTDTVQTKIYEYVGQEISKYSVGNGGKLEKTGSVLGK